MTRLVAVVLTTALALTSPTQVQAQETKTPVQITLDDGTVLIGTINQSLEIQTKFGKLTIPAQDILSARLGYNLTDDEAKEVEKAFKDLDSAQFKERDAAQRYLKTIGARALPMLPKMYGGSTKDDPKDPALEPKRRVEQWTRESKPEEKYLHDYFDTEDSTVKGKVLTKQITVTHQILGDLKVDMARVKMIGSHASTQTNINTDEDWKEVCTLHGVARLTITAEGTIDLWPQTPGQYHTTAKGYTTAGKGGTFMAGALIGKLDNGQPFLVGDSYTVSQPGRLYLRIVENPWNGKSSGSYLVKMERR